MIAINGRTGFAASRQRALAAMTSQPQLARFLPPDSSIEKRDDDSFDFTVVKDIGITTVETVRKP